MAGFSPEDEVAGDKFMVGGNGALVCLSKAVTFLFAFRTPCYECFYYIAEV